MATESRDGAASERGLPELVDAIRWRWKPALLVAAAFFVAATLYVESLPPQYDGTALVAIGPRPDVPSAGSDTVRVVAPKYVAYVTARSTIEKVARRTGTDPDELDDALEANVATDTGNLSISVRLPSAGRAAALANEFAREAVQLSRSDPLLEAQLIAPALPPATPAAPPRRLLEAAALLVGLLLGVGTAALLERARPRVRSWRDLARVTGYPVVGRVPRSRTLRAKPTSAFADPETGSAFRTLRANLEPQLRDGAEVLVVTSPSKGDGKTTVASLFGEALARVDLKTLVIDADLRRPALARLAGVRGERGLSSVLRDGVELEDAIRPGWSDGLSILPTGQDLGAGDLLATRFEEVLERARADFDIVIIDTPPLLGTDDARTLLRLAKGVLLIVSAGTTLDEVNEAVLAIESLRAPLIGIVANRFAEARSTYY